MKDPGQFPRVPLIPLQVYEDSPPFHQTPGAPTLSPRPVDAYLILLWAASFLQSSAKPRIHYVCWVRQLPQEF